MTAMTAMTAMTKRAAMPLGGVNIRIRDNNH
jgi:hypothetical protein